MKSNRICSFFVAFGMALSVSAHADLNAGLVASYPFSGNANDATGHGYNGTVIGGVTPATDRFGNANSAYDFDGINDYINLGTTLDVPSWADYTVSVWFLNDGNGQPSCGYGTGYGEKILDKTVFFHDFYINVCPIGNFDAVVPPPKGYVTFVTYESTGDSMQDPNDAIRDGQWHHVVITKRGSHGEMWIDGELKNTSDNVQTVYSWGPLLVGYSLSPDGYQREFFSGKIDDLRIYDRTLSNAEIQELYGKPSSALASLQSLGDINADGAQDIAVLLHDSAAGTNKAIVKNAATDALVQTVVFNDKSTPKKFMTVPDLNGNGTPELLLLGSGVPQVEVRDSLTGALLKTISFTSSYAAVDVAVVPDQNGNGASELALLGKHVSNGSVRVETRDALSGNVVATTFFSKNCGAQQVLALPDVDGNGVPELAVLCYTAGASINKVEIRNLNGTLLRNVSLLKSAEYSQLTLIDDVNGNGSADLALLRQRPALNMLHVVIVDPATGATVKQVAFNHHYAPVKFVTVPDLNGNGIAELALLGHNAADGSTKAEVRDAFTGAAVKNVWFDKAFAPQDLAAIPDMNGNGAAELGMLGLRTSGSERRVFVKDAGSSASINSIDFTERFVPAKMVAAGGGQTCGLKTDGSVGCWGWDLFAKATPPAGSFSQISAGHHHNCGVKIDGSVACWGGNNDGEGAPPAGSFSQVSAGVNHTCALKSDRTVACWGKDDKGQSTPHTGRFSEVSAGGWHTCGLKADSSVVCWGYNEYGQSTPPGGGFIQLSGGTDHTCGVKTDGSVACWGSDWFGESSPPVGTFRQVSAGMSHSCAVKTDGTVACWGDNTYGGATPPMGSFRQVSAGFGYTCGIKSNGRVACWGANYYGQTDPPPGW